MPKFWMQLRENLLFVGGCALIALALWGAAWLSERGLSRHTNCSRTRRICILGICSALSAVLFLLDFPVPFLVPEFYKLDFSEVPVLLAGFYLGPTAAVTCEGLKVLLKLLLKGTTTAFVGDFANFAVGCSLVLPATIVYHRRHTKSAALWGMTVGTCILTVFGSAFNAIYLLPKFSALYGLSLDAIVEMGSKINPAIRSLSSFVLLAVAPLNLLKGALVSLLTGLLYKRVARPLFGK